MNGPHVSLDDYTDVAPPGAVALVRSLAEGFEGRRFLHVNSTRMGGGVAEILHRLLPLMEELGLKPHWEVISGSPAFFEVTKRLHNTLQGAALPLTDEMREIFIETSRAAADRLDLSADLAMIHDPQPVALIDRRPSGARWLWRCHIDLSHPQRSVWRFLEPFVRRYHGAVFHIPAFTRRLPIPCYVVHPSIDPLAEKNRDMDRAEVERRVQALGVPLDRPVLLQVSRFDPFKDPLGVIEAFRMVRKAYDCVLVLAGGSASDDPEGEMVLARVRAAAGDDPDIKVLQLPNDAHADINALQRAATIVIQKSTREGFGLTVAEAMWKGKPVVGGNVGGIAKQITHGVTGYLIHSVEGCAYIVRRLLADPEERKRVGEVAREYARRHLLITRQLAEHLQLLRLLTRDQ